MKELEPDIDMLLEIARDGAVAPEERDDFAMILGDIEKLLSAALAVKFAEGAQHGNEA